MSNFLAVATATASLTQLLRSAVTQDVPGSGVSTLRPDQLANNPSDGPSVNVFLYQVTSNSGWQTRDLPGRDDRGRILERQRTAIDLHYLLSFFGDDKKLEPQRLLGSAIRTLHSNPVLTRSLIRNTIANVDFDYLAESTLAEDVELVKFTPSKLSMEEWSKLWSVFFQSPYVLSTPYQASVVLIESEDSPRSPLPVRDRNVYVTQIRRPTIEAATAEDGQRRPLSIGEKLIVHGRNLKWELTSLRIAGVEVDPEEVSEDRVAVTLSSAHIPPDALRAGVVPVQVVQKRDMGTPPEPHLGEESNVAAFILRPTIVVPDRATNVRGARQLPRSRTVTIEFDPIVGRGQRVVVLLNEFAEEPPPDVASYAFPAPPRKADAESIKFVFSGVAPATYLVRVQVDGAESLLTVDEDSLSPSFNRFVAPKLVVR